MKEFNPQDSAVEALSALAHDTRLSVFRMLVKAGPEGLIAGAIAQAANVPSSTMSHHLGILERAGLVESERESRLVHYRADYYGMRRLLAFLLQDCCQGVPEMCAELLGELNCQGGGCFPCLTSSTPTRLTMCSSYAQATAPAPFSARS